MGNIKVSGSLRSNTNVCNRDSFFLFFYSASRWRRFVISSARKFRQSSENQNEVFESQKYYQCQNCVSRPVISPMLTEYTSPVVALLVLNERLDMDMQNLIISLDNLLQVIYNHCMNHKQF